MQFWNNALVSLVLLWRISGSGLYLRTHRLRSLIASWSRLSIFQHWMMGTSATFPSFIAKKPAASCRSSQENCYSEAQRDPKQKGLASGNLCGCVEDMLCLRHLELWGIRLLWRLGCGDFGYPLKKFTHTPTTCQNLRVRHVVLMGIQPVGSATITSVV